MTAPLPVELTPPDIAPWRAGNTGVDFVHRFEGDRARAERDGAGADARQRDLRRHRAGLAAAAGLHAPCAGTLTLAFANVEAYARFDAADPYPSRFVDEDFNRVWGDDALFGPRESVELRRARQLQPFVDAADLLLDIHSMSEPCRPLMVCGTVDKNAALARELGVPADLLIDTGHPAGLRMIERGGFGDPASPRRALLVECGYHWEAAAADVAIDTLVRFLGLAGMAEAAWVQAQARLPLPAEQRLVRVTEAVVARSEDFRFLVPTVGLVGGATRRHADRAGRRPGLGDALRRHRAGDAGHAQPQAGRHGGAAGALRGALNGSAAAPGQANARSTACAVSSGLSIGNRCEPSIHDRRSCASARVAARPAWRILRRSRAADEGHRAARRVALQHAAHVVRQRVVDVRFDLAPEGQRDAACRRPAPCRRRCSPAAHPVPSVRRRTWRRSVRTRPRPRASGSAARPRRAPATRA